MSFKVYRREKPLHIDTARLNGVKLSTDQFVSSDEISLDNLITGISIVDKTAKVSFLDPGGRTTALFEELKEEYRNKRKGSRDKIYVEFTDMNTNIKLKLSLRKLELNFHLTPCQRRVIVSATISSRTDTDLDFPI